MNIEKTKVWRYFFEVKGVGFFVWEINECDDDFTEEDLGRYPNMYMKTADGGFILNPTCDFFWSEKKAFDYLYYNPYDEYTDLILINDPIPF